ncbi:hypothetical protein SANTM175S_10035 [Streptomyces antimycoticus]
MAAGVAIENARLYEEARHRQRWLEANAEVTHSLLSGVDETRVLELIVEHATAAPAETLSARPIGSAYRSARSGAARTSSVTVSGFSR